MPNLIKFSADDQYRERVDRLETHFQSKGLGISDNARVLLALAMQSQDSEKILPRDQLFKKLDRFEDQIVQYYVDTYGKHDVNFNRALHLVADLGPMMKYPWKRTDE